MPYIDVDIDVDEFLRNCRKRDIREIIESLVDYGHLPNSVLKMNEDVRKTLSEIEFSEKLDQLKNKYYSLSSEEEELFEKVFKRLL